MICLSDGMRVILMDQIFERGKSIKIWVLGVYQFQVMGKNATILLKAGHDLLNEGKMRISSGHKKFLK